jgi:hypothetical protein
MGPDPLIKQVRPVILFSALYTVDEFGAELFKVSRSHITGIRNGTKRKEISNV